MPIHTPNGGFVAPEWQDLDKKLRTGDGLAWTGDPRLELRIGVLSNGARRGHRLEVWRHNEDGSETRIGHWRPEEQFRVLYDLAQMRLDRPGRVDVVTQIDQHNAAHEAKIEQQAVESRMQILDHALRLHHDRNNPRNRFYMGGAGNRGARA